MKTRCRGPLSLASVLSATIALLIMSACGSDSGPTPTSIPTLTPTVVPQSPTTDLSDSIIAQLQGAQSRWEQSGITSYTYRASWQCFCLKEYAAQVDVQVVNNQVANVKFAEPNFTGDVPEPERFGPIQDRFDFIRDAIEQEASRIDVQFHPEFGYPLKVFVDFDERTADEERGFTILTLPDGDSTGPETTVRDYYDALSSGNATLLPTLFVPEIGPTMQDVTLPSITVENLEIQIVSQTEEDARLNAEYDADFPEDAHVRVTVLLEKRGTRWLISELILPPSEGVVSWTEATQMIMSGEVQQVTQTHAREVTLVLNDGTTLETIEPQLDDVFKAIEQCGELCSDIVLSTE